jgi:threonine synthase
MLVSPLPGTGRDDIDSRTRSLWRYRAALPVAIERPASMGGGCTPLVQKRWGGMEPYFKLEWFNEPTSASAAATIDVLAQRGDIRSTETTVALLTGTGLKSTQFMTELFGGAA